MALNFKKQPSEELDKSIDFTPYLGAETITTIDSVTSVNTLDQSDSSAAIVDASPAPFITGANKKVQFRVIGGAHKEQHKITVKVTSSGGQKFEADLYVNIKDK